MIGRPTTPGVVPATMNPLPFVAATQQPHFTLLQPAEFRGYRIMEQVSIAGVQWAEVKLKMYGYYDLAGWLLAPMLNAPVTAAATGVVLPVLGAVTQSGGNVTNIAIITGGQGMTAVPTIAVTLGTGNTFTGVLTAGVLTSITIGGTGTGYTNSSVATASGGGGGTGGYTSTFKAGLGSVPTVSMQYSYGVGGGPAIWEQMLDAVCSQADIMFSADKLVEIDATFVGPMITLPGPPSIPNFNIAAYAHPWGPQQQSVNLGGAGNGDLISAKVSINEGRAPLHTIQNAPDPLRFLEGPVKVTFDLEADYRVDAASLYQKYRTNTSPGAIKLLCQDNTSSIGSTYFVPLRPSFSLTLPNPYLDSAHLKPDTKGNTQVSAKGKGFIDTVTASGLTAVLTNALAAGYPTS